MSDDLLTRLDSWKSWVDDLPLRPSFGPAQDALQEFMQAQATRIAVLEAELAAGSFYKESDIDALMAYREKAKELRRALEILLHAVCGETGFANAVRQDSGLAYPWPALDEAERIARTALEAGQ